MSIPTGKCEICDATYTKKMSESVERFAQRKYCGLQCSRKAQRKQPRRFGNMYYGSNQADVEATFKQ